MSNQLNEAVSKRRQQRAYNPAEEKSFTEYLREGFGYISKAKAAVGRGASSVVDAIVPDSEDQRVEDAVVRKVNRDESMRKAEYIGEAVGNQIAQTGGFLFKTVYTAVKSATGMTSAKVKQTLREIDEMDNPNTSENSTDSDR